MATRSLETPVLTNHVPPAPRARRAAPVRVVVVGASEVVRTGLVTLLATAGHEAEAIDGLAGVMRTGTRHPDVVLVATAAETAAAGALRDKWPQAARLVFGSTDAFVPADGCAGYLHLDDLDGDTLSRAVTTAAAGGRMGRVRAVAPVPGEARTTEARRRETELTPREREILVLIGEGLTNQEIADGLTLSLKTVETHRANVARKLGLRTRPELIRYALLAGVAVMPGVAA